MDQHQPADDTSSMSDDVFEDADITLRRAEENRRRNELAADMELQLYRSNMYPMYPPSSGGIGAGCSGISGNGGVSSGGGPSGSGTHRMASSGSRYIAPVDENHRYRAVQAMPHAAHDNYDADDDDDFDDDWRSFRYDQVGMYDNQKPQQPFDDTVNHKTILLGDSGVGKTSFLVKYNTGEFRLGSFSATVGIALTNKIVMVDGTKVKLQIWDTAGQERFRSVTHAYYRDAHALLLLYDVTNKNSFDNIRAWLGEIRDYAQDDVVIVLIGNKYDCNSERQVKREEGERLAREHNVPFLETSAKTGHNVELAFLAVARQLKCRGYGNDDDGKFNVHEFVRNGTKARSMCAQCKSM